MIAIVRLMIERPYGLAETDASGATRVDDSRDLSGCAGSPMLAAASRLRGHDAVAVLFDQSSFVSQRFLLATRQLDGWRYVRDRLERRNFPDPQVPSRVPAAL